LVIANNSANSVSVLANRGNGTFGTKRDYRTGPGPYSVAIGDVNGDGKADVATANGGPHTVSVLANRGDGTLRDKRDYPTGRGPASVAIGELNGAGGPELATANNAPATVSVLINRTGLCTVPNVKGRTLSSAKRAIAGANCRVGKIRGAYSKTVKWRRVISQSPKPRAALPKGGKVDLVVSRGRRTS
jgi:hypothetical protein